MKYILHIQIIAIFITVASAYAQPLKLTMAYEDTALPPFYLGEGKEVPAKPGIAIELLKQVDERLHEITINFRRIPWDRCQKELKEGVVDVLVGQDFAKMGYGTIEMLVKVLTEDATYPVLNDSGLEIVDASNIDEVIAEKGTTW